MCWDCRHRAWQGQGQGQGQSPAREECRKCCLLQALQTKLASVRGRETSATTASRANKHRNPLFRGNLEQLEKRILKLQCRGGLLEPSRDQSPRFSACQRCRCALHVLRASGCRCGCWCTHSRPHVRANHAGACREPACADLLFHPPRPCAPVRSHDKTRCDCQRPCARCSRLGHACEYAPLKRSQSPAARRELRNRSPPLVLPPNLVDGLPVRKPPHGSRYDPTCRSSCLRCRLPHFMWCGVRCDWTLRACPHEGALIPKRRSSLAAGCLFRPLLLAPPDLRGRKGGR